MAGGVKQSLGREFGWLWASYAASTLGTWLAFGAFPLIAILVLDAGPAEVAVLAASGPAVGAVLAVPMGPWIEFRRKRPVMVAADAVRFAAMMSVPVAYALDLLSFAQLVLVSVVVAAADITFTAAGGAYLKTLLPPEHLLVANSRIEGTNWTASVLGPPAGGAMIGLFGPVVTVAADAVSYLLSAAGIRAIGGREQRPERPEARSASGQRMRAADLLDGWRHILSDAVLRPLFLNTVLFNGLVMASVPLLAVLMLDDYGFAPWQFSLAFAVPCIGGLVGSRLAPGLVARYGQQRVLLVSGALRACWPLGLAFVGPGLGGLLLVMVVEFGLITCCGVFNPVFATRRLQHTEKDRVSRVLTAWSVTGKASIASMTALWGLLAAALNSPRTAIGIAGLLLLATPLLLPRQAPEPEAEASVTPARRSARQP